MSESEERIFNRLHTLNIDGKSVTVGIDNSDEPWFVVKDICDSLGIVFSNTLFKKLPVEEMLVLEPANHHGEEYILVVNEAGIHSIISYTHKSKSKAKESALWVTSVLLPSIKSQSLN